MIAIGTDIVKNERFVRWLTFSDAQLVRVFHPQEVAQFREFLAKDHDRATQFLASRFAVKEAFFKAYSTALSSFKLQHLQAQPFLFLAPRMMVLSKQGPVELLLDIPFAFPFSPQACHVSLAHEGCCSVATVLLHFAE